jgi:tetratricopeptide (TPR) repeat protein
MDSEFGRRLRALRTEQGLQQSDLAGPGVSVSYVSMLENGNREPTERVIRHLARVLKVQPHELTGPVPSEQLDDAQRLQIAAAEFALANGEHHRAAGEFASLEPILGLPATWGLARALEGMGDLELSLKTLDRVVQQADDAGDDQLLVRAHIARSRCLGDSGEHADALQAALSATGVANVAGLTGTDDHAQAMSTLMARYYWVGDMANAETTARELLELVDAGSSWKARGSAYWNAAGVAEANGDLPRAVQYAQRAVALMSEGDDERLWGRCAVACAWFWMRQVDAAEHLVEIQAMLDQAERKLSLSGTEIDHAYLETEQARAALLSGSAPTAIELCTRALERLGTEPRAEAGTALLVLAESQYEVEDPAGALATADRLEMTLHSLQHNRSAANSWRGLADLYKRLGADDAAYRALEHALNAHAISVTPTPQTRQTERVAQSDG